MSQNKTIMWGFEEPDYIRDEKHRKFLIEQYNRNRPFNEHVHSMEELNRALLTNEINDLGNGNSTNKGAGT